MIDKLELLLALAKERHFGRAAEACGVTQPTMSTSLKQLEEILGVVLVQRGSRFQGFTPEGERTLDWARRIVGDARAMQQEINGLRHKLSGEIKLAAIPTVLGMVAQLTTPFRARHPDVAFASSPCTSADVLGLLENLEVDAGLTYIENEPIGKVRTIPLYDESYRLLTSPDAMFGDRDQVTWKEVGQVPLCLLTPDMQNRRIIDRALRSVGAEATPTLWREFLILRSIANGDASRRMRTRTGKYVKPPPTSSPGRAGVARQRDADHGAGAELRAQLHRAAVQIGQRPRDRQAQPGAVIGLGELALDLLERPAQPLQRMRGDADAGVGDHQHDGIAAASGCAPPPCRRRA